MAVAVPCPPSSLINGAAAAISAAARPSGDRATHSAASSAVTKLPRTWAGRAWQGTHRSSPRCCRPRAASAPPPEPAAAPPRSSAAAPPQPSPPPPAPLAIARRTAPPPQRWRTCPSARPCHRASPAPGRAWAC
eukprot:scaffold28834_cov53-Phaeocystis_antarctica.AAC.1